MWMQDIQICTTTILFVIIVTYSYLVTSVLQHWCGDQTENRLKGLSKGSDKELDQKNEVTLAVITLPDHHHQKEN